MCVQYPCHEIYNIEDKDANIIDWIHIRSNRIFQYESSKNQSKMIKEHQTKMRIKTNNAVRKRRNDNNILKKNKIM